MVLALTDANFSEEVLKSKVPVLVDFWAPWCGPCKMMGPVVEELAEDFKGQNVKICKLNVDDNPMTPNEYGIMSIPTLLIFKKGVPVDQVVGFQPKPGIAEKLRGQLNG